MAHLGAGVENHFRQDYRMNMIYMMKTFLLLALTVVTMGQLGPGSGSIEVGKLADLAVLSKNLLKVAPKECLTTEVVDTIVSGKIVYD